MTDLTPTTEEAPKALGVDEISEKLYAHYNELVRDKRNPEDLATAEDGTELTPWCPAHQKACPERHPFITLEQYVARFDHEVANRLAKSLEEHRAVVLKEFTKA